MKLQTVTFDVYIIVLLILKEYSTPAVRSDRQNRHRPLARNVSCVATSNHHHDNDAAL
jgi:hypothetical protein